MTVKRIWPVTHTCGHLAERDLSDRAADERAGFARWLGERPCADCWRAAHQADAISTKEWLETRRAEEQAESDAWSQQYRMPPLEGTDRAVAWAVRCRHQLLAAAHTSLVLEGETAEAQWEAIEDAGRTVTRAGWWISQRDSEPEDLIELLEAATEADRPVENPHF